MNKKWQFLGPIQTQTPIRYKKILVTVSFDVKHYWSYPSIVKIFIKEEPEIELPRIVLCLNSLHSKVRIK